MRSNSGRSSQGLVYSKRSLTLQIILACANGPIPVSPRIGWAADEDHLKICSKCENGNDQHITQLKMLEALDFESAKCMILQRNRSVTTPPLFLNSCFIRTQISLIKLGLAWSDPTPGFSSTWQFNRRRGNFQKLITRRKHYPERPVDGLFSHVI